MEIVAKPPDIYSNQICIKVKGASHRNKWRYDVPLFDNQIFGTSGAFQFLHQFHHIF